MSRPLNPSTLCNIYTLEEIQSEVDFYKDQLRQATVAGYSKDSTQGSIKADSASMDKIQDTLQSWLKALELKKGMGGVNIVSTSFNKGRFM